MDLPIDDEGHIRFVLDYLGAALEPSILIGGWATFFRTPAPDPAIPAPPLPPGRLMPRHRPARA